MNQWLFLAALLLVVLAIQYLRGRWLTTLAWQRHQQRSPAQLTRLAKALAWPLLIVALGCLSLAIDNPFCRQAALGCYLVGALGAGWDPTLLPASSLKTKAVAWVGPGHGFCCG